MKRIIALILASLMMLALCACGAQQAPAAPEETAAQVEATPEVTAEPEQATPPEGMASTLPGAEASEGKENEANANRELAVSLINEDIAKLIEKIGEPKSRDYAPSCLGEGEDGELVFDGFTVYTYKTAESEIIQDVE